MPQKRRSPASPRQTSPRTRRAPDTPQSAKHHDYIAIERDEGQAVHVTIGQPTLGEPTLGEPTLGEPTLGEPTLGEPTAGGREIDGGFSQLFNRVMSSGIYAALPLPARAVYTALVFLADNGRFFIVDGHRGPSANQPGNHPDNAPGVNLDRLMQVSGCGETAVKHAMKTLVDRQLIRVLRKGGSKRHGRRVASIYQLLLPVAGYESVHLPDPETTNLPGHDTTRYGGATRRGSVAQDAPVPRREATPHSSAKRGGTPAQNVHSDRTSNKVDRLQTSAEAIGALLDEHDIDTATAEMLLRERGVSDLMVGRAIEQCEPLQIATQVLDFELRNRKPGRPKTAGWLAKSVLVGYDLHGDTEMFLAEQEQRTAAARRRRKAEDAERAEADRQAKIDVWVAQEFDAADDEELAIWHRKVTEQYPKLVRGLDKADPRSHPRLRTLIQGMLASLWPGE